MIIRSKAPFRLGLAGGGTDVSPYSDEYGGAILNATVNLFAHTSIKPTDDGKIVFINENTEERVTFDSKTKLPPNEHLDLQIGVYNRIVAQFVNEPLSFVMTTSTDVPTRSGLGTSSTIVVSMIGAFVEWLKLPLGEYDIAHLAYEIERNDLKMAGGKQDQYAATFGGVNFMEFLSDDKVIVNPLRTKKSFMNELNFDLILYYTQSSRDSSKIISTQIQNVEKSDPVSVGAMHELKKQAFELKQIFLNSEIHKVGSTLHQSWLHKKKMAQGISNPMIDDLYEASIAAGARGGKISGAGGGGFMLFFAEDTARYEVERALKRFGGHVVNYQFTNKGLDTWTTR